jgi:hypothetical protein
VRLQLSKRALPWLLAFGCVASARAEPPWTLSSDSLLYTDTDNVLVVSSQLGVDRALDDDGGKASALMVVDVVSAASVDVVSQASMRFTEVRAEADLALSLALSDALVSVDYRGSTEPDYRSHGVGAGYQTRLGSPDTVLGADYQITFDTVGRSGTPFDNWSRSLTSHAADLSVTQTIGPTTVVRGVYTLTVQDGYLEKPYRFVPLFDAAGLARARADAVTLDLESFDRYRLSTRPPEEVPSLRLRHAIAVRALQYLRAIDGSLRADYRFYLDDWQITSHSAEASVWSVLGGGFELELFGRGYLQSAASFYERIYVVANEGEVPRLRTADRKLSPYRSLTGGSRLRLRAGPIVAYLEGSVMGTWFTDYLLLDHELALVSQGGLSWSF